jgi:hypothetical protein
MEVTERTVGTFFQAAMLNLLIKDDIQQEQLSTYLLFTITCGMKGYRRRHEEWSEYDNYCN